MAVYSHNANDLTPVMTSNTTPSPVVVSASTEYNASYAAWKAFNHLVGASGWASTAGHTGWLKVYSGGDLWTVTSYTVSSCTDSLVAMAKDWTLQGSTDNNSWVTLDTQSNQINWTSDDTRTYTITSPGNYSYYKLDITDNCGNNDATEVGELELIGTIYVFPPPPSSKVPSGDIVPRSNGFGSLGTSIKKWFNGYFYNIFATGGTISGVNMISDSGETISGPVVTSAGVGDARKLPALGTDGKLSLTFMPDGIGGNVTVSGVTTSSGAVDAGKIPKLNQLGLLDLSFFPSGIGGGTTVSGATTSSGIVDAGKFTKLDSSGKLDLSFFPTNASAASSYVGVVTSEALSAGDIVNIYDYGGAKCRKASAVTSGKEANGYVLNAVDYGALAVVYSGGNNTSVSSLSIGTQYLSATVPGKCTSIPPSGVGVVSQKVGFATSSTSLTFQREIPVVLAS